MRRVGGSLQQLIARGELHPRALPALALLDLAAVDSPPALDRDEVGPALGQQRLDLLAAWVRRLGERPGAQVLDQAAHRLLGVALVRPKDPGRPALDPAH